MNARRNYQKIQDIGQTTWGSNSPLLRIVHLKNGYQFWQKGGGQKKRFQYCVNPNFSQKFLYLRAIQGHSGSTINLALQDYVLLPEEFTEKIYHVGNGKELRSIVNQWFDSTRESVSKQADNAVFFTVVSPMDNQDGSGGNPVRLVKGKNRATRKYLETLSGYSILIKCSYSLRHTACRVQLGKRYA